LLDSPLGTIFNHYSSLVTQDGQVYYLYLGYSLKNLDELLARSRQNFWLMIAALSITGLIIFAGIYRLHTKFQLATIESVRQAQEKEKFREILGFTAGVAHEVKNPLNSLTLLFELLEKKAPPELSRQVRLGKIEIEKIATIIDRFSELLKPVSLRKEFFDFNEILSDEINNLQSEAASRNIKIDLKFDPDLWLQADRFLLSRAISNLLKNALEASPPGSRVLVSAERRKKALVFSVADQGPGIPAAQQEKIFEPFISTKESGLGLGLYLVKKIVEAHGGKIYLTNQPSGGAVFTFEIPGGHHD